MTSRPTAPTDLFAIIVGAGPAGLLCALHLKRLRPDLAGRTLVLEKARHPRKKLCGGGVNAKALPSLKAAGIDLRREGPPSFEAQGYDVRFEKKRALFAEPGGTLIFDRARLDAFLAEKARAAGIEIHEGEGAEEIEIGKDGVRVCSGAATYEAACVVGADGVGSLARRVAGIRETYPRGRLLQAEVPLKGETRELLFDFSCLSSGVAGYTWLFPEPGEGGRLVAKIGIYDRTARTSRRVNPRPVICELARGWGYEVSEDDFEAWSVREWTPRARLSAPRVLLVGDAAGVDALVAEGLHQSFEYGRLAAEALARASDHGDFSFASYTRAVRKSPLGAELARNRAAAQFLYGPFHRQALAVGFRYPGILERVFAYIAGRAPELTPLEPWQVVVKAVWHAARRVAGISA